MSNATGQRGASRGIAPCKLKQHVQDDFSRVGNHVQGRERPLKASCGLREHGHPESQES